MQLRMWMYDLAREQTPSLEHLRRFCDVTLDGGYNAIGLYLEHRFAYPATPWAHGKFALTPDAVGHLQREYPQLQIIPFINLLGHFEGMLYTEEGKRFAEQRFAGMQACPCNPEFVDLAKSIIDDTVDAFNSEIIHIGGDETWQLGQCPKCAARINTQDPIPNTRDPKAILYGEHFGPLAVYVKSKGRRPAVWGDMYLDHPAALGYMPKETLIFDWQYFKSPLDTSRKFKEQGFDVVCSPTLHVYNAVWMHLPQSEANVIEAAAAAHDLDAFGVCVTTWEAGLFGNYETLLPAIKASGRLLAEEKLKPTTLTEEERKAGIVPDHHAFLAEYAAESPDHREWAELMGVQLQNLGGCFAFSGTRSSLKCRLLLYSNPFLAWLYHAEELNGEIGTQSLEILERAVQVAPNVNYRGVAEFVKSAIMFVRLADQARQAYAQGLPGVATASLAPCRQIFDHLESIAKANHLNIGGSLADIERCKIAREHVERVVRRIKEYGDGSLGYLPAFEIITHPKFVPHDQASWWLINRWANE